MGLPTGIYDVGERWSSHRKMIQTSFHISILEKFLETFVSASEVLIEKLNAAPTELNITHFVNNCVIDILNGKSVNCDEVKKNLKIVYSLRGSIRRTRKK